MKCKEYTCCDWCYLVFWDNDLSNTYTLGHLIFCSKQCRDNYTYIKRGCKE